MSVSDSTRNARPTCPKNGYTKNQNCGNIYKKSQLRSQEKTQESRHCVVVKLITKNLPRCVHCPSPCSVHQPVTCLAITVTPLLFSTPSQIPRAVLLSPVVRWLPATSSPFRLCVARRSLHLILLVLLFPSHSAPVVCRLSCCGRRCRVCRVCGEN